MAAQNRAGNRHRFGEPSDNHHRCCPTLTFHDPVELGNDLHRADLPSGIQRGAKLWTVAVPASALDLDELGGKPVMLAEVALDELALCVQTWQASQPLTLRRNHQLRWGDGDVPQRIVTGAKEMRKNKVVKWLVGLLLIGIAWGLIKRITPHERLLLSRCSFVAGRDQFDTYNWQSDHSILLFRRRPEYPYPWSLEKVNLLTGQHFSYLALAKQFEHENTIASNFETSPDGNWLLWSATDFHNSFGSRRFLYGFDTGHATGWLANLQTGHVEHFPVGSTFAIDSSLPHDLYWMADSKHWAEIDVGQSMWSSPGKSSKYGPSIIRNVNAPRQAKRMKLRSDWNLNAFAGIRVLSEEHVVATTLTNYNRAENYWGLPELVQTGLKDNSSPTRRGPLTLPYGTQIMAEVAFSPQGDRYAIAAVVDPHPFWMDVLHRWHLPVRIPSHPQVGIWIFSLNGNQNQEIGQITPERDNTQYALFPYEMPRDLRWSPDGKYLGFVYKGTLYRVPTD